MFQLSVMAPIQPVQRQPPKESIVPQNAPPKFVRGPLPFSTPTDETVTVCPGLLSIQETVPMKLEVQVVGNPEPVVSWFVNDQPVRPDFKHKVSMLTL